MERARLTQQLGFPGRREAVSAQQLWKGPTGACGTENRLIISTLLLHQPCQLITHHKSGGGRCAAAAAGSLALAPAAAAAAGCCTRGRPQEIRRPAQRSRPRGPVVGDARRTSCWRSGQPPADVPWPVGRGAGVAQSGPERPDAAGDPRYRRAGGTPVRRGQQLCKEDVGDTHGRL